MADNMIVLVFSVLWTLRYSDAFAVCCNITRIQGESHVTCSGCRLLSVPMDLPTSTTVLNLGDNNLNILQRDSFPKLPLLKILYLQRNRLVSILSGTFDNLRNIENLDLSDNELDHLSLDSSIFENLKNLKSLKMHRNNFYAKKVYPEYAISTISNLEILFLDIFEGFSFGDGFLNLTRLQKIYLSSSGPGGVSLFNTSFKGLKRSNITELSITAYIKIIETNFLYPFTELKALKLETGYQPMTIHDALLGLYGIKGREMDSLSLKGFQERFTKGVTLLKADLVYLGSICVKKLFLVADGITAIGTEGVTAWVTRTCIEVLDVSWNMFHIPGSLTLLVLFSSLTHLFATYSENTRFRKRSILAASEHTIFLPRNLLYINIAHSRMSGPLINITIGGHNSLQVLNISSSVRFPYCSFAVIKGLVHLKEFDMSGVDCSEINRNMFSEFPNISRLTARQCDLKKVIAFNTPSIFKGLHNLSFVDISSNDLDSLNISLFADQKESLNSLTLSRNYFDRIPTQLLTKLTVLERLDMSNNLISTLKEPEYTLLEELNTKSGKMQIALFGNPLVCSCDNLDFLSWLETTQAVYKKLDLMCSTPEGNQIKIGEFLDSFDQFKEDCVSQTWLIISITLTVLFFVLGFLSREAWRRSVWLRVVCRQPVKHASYTSDIYICYCNEDSGWVAKTLIPWLDEKEIEYLFEDKSFQPGRDIADNIMDAIDCSRQTVFVVSCSFLEQEWTTFTLRLTNEYSFRDGRENMNILILLNDIKKSEFPKLVRTNWDMIRPLRWPNENNTPPEKLTSVQDRFWERLSKRIRRGKDHFMPAHVSESTL
ncbi:toll-like receptor 2 type-1 [Pecten maximus]|uniref:toll-like receptor 2 type-1 n=1 Tax=Pecten maximus TaxID=6579 RepID=UPI0014583DC2|nr:toll-like receptor 2 type-1 [Pecten maximus]